MSAKKSRRKPVAEDSIPPRSTWREVFTQGFENYGYKLPLVLGVAWLVYLAMFSATELPSLPVRNDNGSPLIRLQLWLFAADPTTMLSTWLGGSWQNFGLAARLWVGAWSAFLLALAYAPGRLLLDAVLPKFPWLRWERGVFAVALGLHLQSLWVLALGLAGGLHLGWIAAVPALLAWIVLLMHMYRSAGSSAELVQPMAWPGSKDADRPHSSIAPEDDDDPKTPYTYTWIFEWAALPFLVIVLLGAMLPPHDFDVREDHLQAPKEWYQQGFISFMPHNVYANMPLGAEMQSLTAMCLLPGDDAWWWGALIGKTVMACFVPLTALGLYCAGRRWFSSTAGVVAALLYVSTPWIARTAMKGLNEPAVACYTLLAVYAVWLAMHAVASPFRCYLLAGLLAGAGVACKYPALLFVGVPLAAWPLVQWGVQSWKAGTIRQIGRAGNQPTRAFGFSILFLVAMLVSCGLWLAKNAVLTGNPTYPLLYDLFGGLTRTPASNAQWEAAHGGGMPFSLSSMQASIGRLNGRSEWMSPLLVPLALLGLSDAWHRWRKEFYLGLSFVLFGVVAWYGATHRIDRFLVPLIPLVCLLGGIGAAALLHSYSQYAVNAMLAMGLLLNLLTIGSVAMGDARLLVELAPLRQHDPIRIDPVHAWLNEHAPPGSKVLLVGDAEPFDLQIPTVYNTVFDANRFEQLMRGHTASERRAALRELGVTHVYVHWGHIGRYRSPGNYGFTDYVTHELLDRELVQEQHVLEVVPEFAGSLYRVSDS